MIKTVKSNPYGETSLSVCQWPEASKTVLPNMGQYFGYHLPYNMICIRNLIRYIVEKSQLSIYVL